MVVPKLRFKADDGSNYPDFVEIKIGDAIKEAKRPLDMEDDEKYQLVTVKRRNEGIVSRGMFYGRDILVKNYYTVKKGDYIISKRQVIHGANGIVPPELDDAIVSNEYMVLTDSSTLLVNYLALYSMTKKMYHIFYISSYGVDIEKMFFNVDDWKKKKIMVPCIKEQQKVVKLFSLIDTVIGKQKETVSAWEERKKGVMQKLFSQEVRFKADDGSDFPEWEDGRLGELCSYRRGSFPQPYGAEEWYDEENGKPFIQVADVGDNMKLLPDTKRHISKAAMPMSVFVDAGTLIVTLQGSIGRIAITDYDAYIDRTLLIIQNIDSRLKKEFLQYALFVLFADEKKRADGGTIKTITKETLTNFTFKFPCLAEQQKIADCLSSLNEVIEKQKAILAAWEELKKGLLQQMFV